MKLNKIKEYTKINEKVKKVMCMLINICIVLCLIACYILCTYIYKSNPIIFYIGISLLKSSLIYIAICVIFGIIFNKLLNELLN